MFWITDIIRRIIPLRGRGVDCCCGTFSEPMACKSFSPHRRFVECDTDMVCVDSSFGRFAMVSVWQTLNKDFDIMGDNNVYQVAFSFFQAVEEMDERRPIKVLKSPALFTIMQTFPIQIPYHRSTYRIQYHRGDQTRYEAVNLWETRCRLGLYMLEVRSLLAADYSVFEVRVKV